MPFLNHLNLFVNRGKNSSFDYIDIHCHFHLYLRDLIHTWRPQILCRRKRKFASLSDSFWGFAGWALSKLTKKEDSLLPYAWYFIITVRVGLVTKELISSLWFLHWLLFSNLSSAFIQHSLNIHIYLFLHLLLPLTPKNLKIKNLPL